MKHSKEYAKLDWRSIKRHYWPFIVQYSWLQAVMLLAYGVGSLTAAAAMPLIYKQLMDAVSGSEQASSPLLTLLLLLVTAIVLKNVFHRIGDFLIIKVQARTKRQLYDYAMEELMYRSYTFYSNSFAGSLVAKVKRFVRAFEELHDQFVFHIWMSSIELLASMAVLWYFSWELGVLFFGWLVLYAILVRFMVRWSIPKSLRMAEGDSNITADLSDTLTNMLTVKMFGANAREFARFQETTSDFEERTRTAWMQHGFWNTLFQGAAVGIFEMAIVVFVVLLWQQQVVTAGLVLLVVMYVVRNINIVWMISRNVLNISRALTDANEMVQLLNVPTDVVDPVEPEPVKISGGSIAFCGVTHAYENNEHVFCNLDFEVTSGEKVALVGYSGSGKSTIVKLLLRFVDVQKGSITIDGQDIRNLNQNALRERIAYVPQDPALFHRSLHENIAYGRKGATFEQVQDAAKRAQAHEFIMQFPQGYDTLVGERGVKLSGGERQRIAIARALLKEAPIVVLDEATSSLDSVSERYVQAAFDELMADRTTIVIAHRLSTIQHMDRIVVLHEGEIAEQGGHAALLVQHGIYAKLWEHQVGGFIQDAQKNGSEQASVPHVA